MDCQHAGGDHLDVDSFSILHLSSRGGSIERAQLRCSFQALTLRQAAALAAELKTMAACTPHVRATPAPPSERRYWIVTVTTPPIPLTLTVLQRWEEELLAIEQRWSGCRFLGWRTPAGASLLRHSSSAHENGGLRRAAQS